MSDDARLLSEQRLQAIRYQAMADACDSRMNGLFRRKAEEQCLLLAHIDAQAERIRSLDRLLDALLSPLEWSSEVPTRAGWYWHSFPTTKARIIWLPAQSRLRADRGDRWAGPILAPAEPEVEAKQPPAPAPTPVQPRKRHHYDPNGWYF